jgi:UDP-GlcNAc3NAcA epimerase
MHRQENTDVPERLKGIFDGLKDSVLPIIWPVHPRTAKMMNSFGIQHPACIRLIDPVGYLDMVELEKNAKLIVTDSGGVQKEAFYHAIPSLTLRDETEWLELVTLGATQIVGANPNLIRKGLQKEGIIVDPANSVYGAGDSGNKIVSVISSFLK